MTNVHIVLARMTHFRSHTSKQWPSGKNAHTGFAANNLPSLPALSTMSASRTSCVGFFLRVGCALGWLDGRVHSRGGIVTGELALWLARGEGGSSLH